MHWRLGKAAHGVGKSQLGQLHPKPGRLREMAPFDSISVKLEYILGHSCFVHLARGARIISGPVQVLGFPPSQVLNGPGESGHPA